MPCVVFGFSLRSSNDSSHDMYLNSLKFELLFMLVLEPCQHYFLLYCQGGVQRVHLLDGTKGGVLLLELFTRDGLGTMVARYDYHLLKNLIINCDLMSCADYLCGDDKLKYVLLIDRHYGPLSLSLYIYIYIWLTS